MIKPVSLVVLSILVLLLLTTIDVLAQDLPGQRDTFFLSKRKGLLGKLGKSISVDQPGIIPIKTANPYRIHAGKTIRSIEIMSLGFERNINDTNKVRNTFSVILANAFHKNTREKIIANNLFFHEGSKVDPYVIADNERHLRDQVYIKDARILVVGVTGSTDLVDVIVITKDIFSIGGNVGISSLNRVRLGVKDANFGGTGSEVSVSSFYERDRHPNFGYGAELIKRNLRGSFIDWTIGFQTYRRAFSSGRNQENYFYTRLAKPLVSLSTPWIGDAELSVGKTNNYYTRDSLYQSDHMYGYYNGDAWFGYNFASRQQLSEDLTYKVSNRLRKFIGIRGLYQRFNELPKKNEVIYDYRYADIRAALLSFSIFKQEFYRTNFIYGFGINEDVPEGISASIIGGWTDKEKRTRSYYGVEARRSHFSKMGYYTTYTFRFGSYSYKKKWEDTDLLIGLDHFTRLRKLGSMWFNRNFYSASFTQQMRPVLNQPLVLRSMFGLPYYDNTTIAADLRGTVRGETVFYNMNKYWGFRTAPFFFGDLSAIRPINESYKKAELYSAWGAGVRARNENLIFGTIELRAYVFPRPIGYMKGYKIDLSTSLRFKFNNTIIRKPDFVLPN
jgi:hypothetical protein